MKAKKKRKKNLTDLTSPCLHRLHCRIFILDHTKHLTTLPSALGSGHPAHRQTFNISQSLLEIAPDIFSGSQLFSTLGARVQCLQTQAWANSAKEKHNSLCCAVSLCVCIYSSIKQTMWYIPEGHTKKHLCRVMDWGNSPQKCCNSLFVCPDVECPQTFFFLFPPAIIFWEHFSSDDCLVKYVITGNLDAIKIKLRPVDDFS